MGDSEYQEALRQEAAWLDEQLEKYVAGKQPTTRAIYDSANNIAPTPTSASGGFSDPYEDALAMQSGNDMVVKASADLGVAQPPQPSAMQRMFSTISLGQAVLLFLLAVVVSYAVWQTMQAIGYKQQALRAEQNIQQWAEAQTDLDNALCDAGYPAVVSALKEKAAKDRDSKDLTNSEKALLAFGAYRTATPKITAGGFRVDAVPPCADAKRSDAAGQSPIRTGPIRTDASTRDEAVGTR